MSTQFEIQPEDQIRREPVSVFEAIRDRRATRSFSDKPVSDTLIQALIDYATQAPSAVNRQPWSFLVIENKNVLKQISTAAKDRMLSSPKALPPHREHGHHHLTEPGFDLLYGAPLLIVICASMANQGPFSAESDCFLAGENLMLAATGMGLASCPIGLVRDVLREPELSQKVGLAKGAVPVLPIAVGYASANMPVAPRNPPVIRWVR
jgi:nitroreductase